MDKKKAEEILLAKGMLPVTINGVSMLPLIMKGEVFYVKAKREGYELGDIVLYNSPIGKMVHRIVKVKKDGYIIKGDNFYKADDGLIKQEDIIGVLLCKNVAKKRIAFISWVDILLCSKASDAFILKVKKIKHSCIKLCGSLKE